MTLTVSPGELWEDTGDDVTLRRITLWTLVICCVCVNFFYKRKTALWIRGVRLHIYSAPDRGAEYCDERVFLSVCVCLSVCNRIFNTTRPIQSCPWVHFV